MTKKTTKSKRKLTKVETTKEQQTQPKMLSGSVSSISDNLSKAQATNKLTILDSVDVANQTKVKDFFKVLSSKLSRTNLRFYLLSFLSGVAVVLLVLHLLGFFYSLPKGSNQLEVKGMATTEVDLDIVEFIFSTKSEGEDIKELVKLEQAKQEAIYKFWQTQGVEPQAIQTNQSFLAISLPTSFTESKPLYNLQTYYRVVFKNLLAPEVMEEIKARLYQIGINQLEPLIFTSESLDSVCQDLLVQAQQKAWLRAQQILQKNGFHSVVRKQFTVLRDCASTDFSFFDHQPGTNQITGWYSTPNQFSNQKQTLRTVVKLVVEYYD